MKYIVISAVLLTLSASAFAQKTPTFARYAARVENLRNVKVDLASNKDARRFRTNLREAAKGGVNFAGHFILTGWGCGTNCEQLAIIDGRNGEVFFPSQLEGVGIGFCDVPEGAVASDAPPENEYLAGVYFKNNSRLLILQGFKGGDLNKPRSKCGNYYWEWTGAAMRQVSFKPGKRVETP